MLFVFQTWDGKDLLDQTILNLKDSAFCFLVFKSIANNKLQKKNLRGSLFHNLVSPLKGTWGQSNNFCLKWSFFKTKWHQTKLPNIYMSSTISILFMFICMDDATCVETQFDHSKLCNFISSWGMAKMTIKLRKGSFLIKLRKR